MLQLLQEDCLFTYPYLSVAKYSVILLGELWQRGIDEIPNVSERKQEDSDLGSLDQ